MQFNSYTFVVFFLVVLAVHALPLPWRARKLNLLIASYVFYAAWDPIFILLIWISTVTDWWLGSAIHRSPQLARKRLLLAGSLAVNLGLLGYFKYRAFVLSSLSEIGQSLGVHFDAGAGALILPIGISFYTFQTLSYSLDIYRGTRAPCRHFLDFALYVTFFPQLVAGPIVRSGDFLPQCDRAPEIPGRQRSWGFALLVLGVFQKMVLADAVAAPIVERVFDARAVPDALSVWCGSLAFAAQVFFDFAGYSTCAIGAALCLGFSLPDNFRAPYAAVGFNDLWNRWHITLSTWLRDYVFVPSSRAVLRRAGRRSGELAVMSAALVTMTLCGLWHGAGWTFIVWGAIHGGLLIAERLATRLLGGWPGWRREGSQLCLALLTFLIWCGTVVVFRASTLREAARLWRSMLGGAPVDAVRVLKTPEVVLALGLSAALVACHWYLRSRTLEDVVARAPRFMVPLWIGVMLAAIATVHGRDRAFIYFQF